MNYYEHHLGDYAKDAAHLSLIEDGAYRRLLDSYYTREQPLPGDVKLCCKLARANTKSEREAVAYVLEEFFDLREDGYHQNRADAEIARFQAKSEKARAAAQLSVAARAEKAALSGKALRAERMAAARAKGTHTKEEWQALRFVCGYRCVKCGREGHQDRDHIVPVYQGGSDGIENIQPLCAWCNSGKGPERVDYRPKDWRANVERTLSERPEEFERTLSERSTPRARPQSPVTSNQSAIGSSPADGSISGDQPPASVVGDRNALVAKAVEANPALGYVVALRKRGGVWLRLTPENPTILAAVAEGVSLASIEAMADAYPNKPPTYVINAARNDRAEPAQPVSGGTHAAGPKPIKGAVAETLAAIQRRRDREAAGTTATPLLEHGT